MEPDRPGQGAQSGGRPPRGTPTRQRLEVLARRVRSGDPGNVEAQAARSYWAALFGQAGLDGPFRRRREGPEPNGLLNYGYAVVRAALARAVCAAGLHPGLALHHSNRSNTLALVDDLIEPLRPMVDREVLSLLQEGCEEVDRASKARLLSLLTHMLRVGSSLRPFGAAVEAYVASLLSAYGAVADSARDRARRLLLPDLRPVPEA